MTVASDLPSGVLLRDLLREGDALDERAFRARFGDAFFVLETALVASPFDLDGTLPAGDRDENLSPAAPPTEHVVYLLRRRTQTGARHVTLGRAESVDVVMNDRSVSKLHAFLETEGGGARVQDAGSKNGTYVNGARLPSPPNAGFVALAAGDVVMFGTIKGRFLDAARMHAWLRVHPSRPARRMQDGRRVERTDLIDEDAVGVFEAARDALDAVARFREGGVELGLPGGTKTLTDLEPMRFPSSGSDAD